MVMPAGKAAQIVLDLPMVKKVLKYGVSKACEPSIDAVFSTRDISEEDRKEVVDLICRSLDLVVDYSLEHKVDPAKAGILILGGGVSVKNLTARQQYLCAAALARFAANAADFTKEGYDTIVDTMEFAEVGEAMDPAGGAVLGAATGFSIHAADDYSKLVKLVNAAYDAHSQCGPLSFKDIAKPRDPDSSPTAFACYPDDAPALHAGPP